MAAEIKENLHILLSLAESKAKIFEDEIILDLKTGKTVDDLTVPITKVVKKTIQYRGMTSVDNGNVFNEVSKSITEMISDQSANGIVAGVAKIATSALNAVMGVGEGYEQVVKRYSVVTDYPSIVRFDFAFWARGIQAKSLRSKCETAFACVAYKSAVDVNKLNFNDFLTLYGEVLNEGFGSDKDKMKEMIIAAREIYNMYNVNTPLKLANSDLDKDENLLNLIIENQSTQLANKRMFVSEQSPVTSFRRQI